MKMIAKVIDHQSKQIAYNCYTFFKKRKLVKGTREHNLDINLIDTVAEATGLSKTTVTRIIREGNALLYDNPNQPVVFPAQEKVKHVRAKRIAINEKTECVLRRKVIQFYSTSKEVPSVRKLNALLKKEGILNCSDEYLRQLLHKLGFTNSDDDLPGRFKESVEIVKERLDYLKAIRDCRDKGKNVFFLNETKRWTDEDMDLESNDLPSFITVHASGTEGFSDVSTVILKLKSNSNLDKKFEQFQNYDWMKDCIIPNLPTAAVIVLNMPQCESHTAIQSDPKPHEASTRASMENWLNRHNISFIETDSKAQLIQRISNVESNLKYSLTKLLEEHNYEVLFLPQKYQDLNPIAIMWDDIKKEVEKDSAVDLIMNYPYEKWGQCFKKVKAFENEYYSHDANVDLSLSSVKTEKDNVNEIKKEPTESVSDMDQDSDEDNDNDK